MRTVTSGRPPETVTSTSGPAAVVLNTWAAEDLGAGVGDELQLVYYLWEEEGRLVTHQTDLRVVDVVPIEGPTAYNHLSVRAAVAITLDRLLGAKSPENRGI